jgi:glutaryl-CoA dehydrogenase
MTTTTAKAPARFDWADPFLLDQQLTDEERMVRDSARAYCQDRLSPRVLEMFRHESSDVSIFRELGESPTAWSRVRWSGSIPGSAR